MKTPRAKAKAKAKEKAWRIFSKYIRLKYADRNGYVKCVTCGKRDHYKNLHAGHFIDGRNNSILFNERLVFPQCFHCNSKLMGCLAGNKVSYTLFMLKRYSKKQIEEFESMKFQTKKMGISDFKDIEEKYLDKLVGLDMKGER